MSILSVKGAKQLKEKQCRILFFSLLFIVALLTARCLVFSWDLVVLAPKTGTTPAYLPLNRNTFNLSYIHSVTGREVVGTFAITGDGKILPLTTEYDSFGPGLPYLDGSLKYELQEGCFVVYHDDEPRASISLFVSPLTGETLRSGKNELKLGARQDAPVLVKIQAQRRFRRFFIPRKGCTEDGQN